MKKAILGAVVSVSVLLSAVVGVKTVDSQKKEFTKKTVTVEAKYNQAKYLCSDEPTFPPPLRMRRCSDNPTFPPPL